MTAQFIEQYGVESDLDAERAEHYDVIVIGAGQAGLATGYYLAQHGVNFIILDAGNEVGEVWSKRWDSLRLFSPAKYSSLPGFAFPAAPFHLPTKDEVATYFKAYVTRFHLPVRLGVKVTRVYREEQQYLLETNAGLFSASHVVIAIGTYHAPKIPAFAKDLDASIVQLHSSQYHNPQQIEAGKVMVVGASSSGGQIAVDLAQTHEVYLAGRDPGNSPRRFLGMDIYWWLYTTGLGHLRRDSWLGRRVARTIDDGSGHGGGRVALSAQTILDAGVRWVSRVVGTRNGLPLLDDGQVLDVQAIVWATGYRPDYRWVEDMPLNRAGYPVHTRGVVEGEPGLYVMGLVFQYRMNSHMVGGVGRDAEYLGKVIAERLQTSPDKDQPRRRVSGRLSAMWHSSTTIGYPAG
jgi:putative flavoprotein involved in K+ transport